MAAYQDQPFTGMDKQIALESRAQGPHLAHDGESDEYHESLRGHTRADQADMMRMGKYRPLSALAFTVILQGTWEVLLT